MKDQFRRRETWMIVASLLAYWGVIAVALWQATTGDGFAAEEIGTYIGLASTALTGLGIGGVAQVKRSAQRGVQDAQQITPVIEEIKQSIAELRAQQPQPTPLEQVHAHFAGGQRMQVVTHTDPLPTPPPAQPDDRLGP